MKLINDKTLVAIADAIRNKTGKTGKIKPEDMPDAIKSIKAGGAVIIPALMEFNIDIRHFYIASFDWRDGPVKTTLTIVEG